MNVDNDQLDQIFQALSDTTRRNILMQIRKQDQTVNDIATQYQISLPAVSKHLKVLERAGLISRKKDGRKRLCHAEPSRLAQPLTWLEFYQSFWNDKLESLKNYVEKENKS